MAVARVVAFDGVSQERIDQLSAQVSSAEKPEGLPATEMILLHDADAGTALAIIFFDNDADYEQGNAVLMAMPSDQVPGNRTSVTKYNVAARMTD
jgi:hypothetical protein